MNRKPKRILLIVVLLVALLGLAGGRILRHLQPGHPRGCGPAPGQ